MGKVLWKRVYDLPEKGDGFRILADRLWPRGISSVCRQAVGKGNEKGRC